jgi:hypothetical protein
VRSYRVSLKGFPVEGQTEEGPEACWLGRSGGHPAPAQELSRLPLESEKADRPPPPYPLTLIFENESTARPAVGMPIEVAGRKVVKMSMFFTCGNNSCESLELDKIR